MFKKEKSYCIRSGIIQQPANAGSRRIGVKTAARPGVDESLRMFRPNPHFYQSAKMIIKEKSTLLTMQG